MKDPVVASDGHSYERSAIQDVLERGNGLSPLTREVLTPTLFPNRNLKKRIREHDEDVLQMAEQAAATAVAREAQRQIEEEGERPRRLRQRRG